jgi:hypothetical protein
MAPYTGTHIEVLGAESCYGAQARASDVREVILRLSASHPRKEALALLAREIAPAGTSWAPGTTGAGGGRASASPLIRQYAFLLPKQMVTPQVQMVGGAMLAVTAAVTVASPVTADQHPTPSAADAAEHASAVMTSVGPVGDTITVPLIRLAWARSGDKGDISNIGVIARHPAWLALLRAQLTEAAVASYLAHLVKGRVTRFELPGIDAFNFVCEQALDGGGMASMRNDALGKGMAQILLSMPVVVPADLQPGVENRS